MTLDHIARRKINLNRAAQSHTHCDATRFFCARWGGPTSAEIRARISEISHILGLSARWLRDCISLDTVSAPEWVVCDG